MFAYQSCSNIHWSICGYSLNDVFQSCKMRFIVLLSKHSIKVELFVHFIPSANLDVG